MPFYIDLENKKISTDKTDLQKVIKELHPLFGDHIEFYDIELNSDIGNQYSHDSDNSLLNEFNKLKDIVNGTSLLKSESVKNKDLSLVKFKPPVKLCTPDFNGTKLIDGLELDKKSKLITFKILFSELDDSTLHFQFKLLEDWKKLLYNDRDETYRKKEDYKGSVQLSYLTDGKIKKFTLTNINPLIKETKLDIYSLEEIRNHYHKSDVIELIFQYDDLILNI